MPVSTKHPEYVYWSADWQKCRDAYDGQRAIKAAGVKYLPKLSEQTAEDYDSYKQRALFYSITSKSVGALVGMVVAKRPVIKSPKGMEPYFTEDSGTQFYELLATATSETLLLGRYGVLVDRIGNGMPQMNGYKAESILNWKVDDRGMPYMVVLKECVYKEEDNDEFTQTTRVQYRVLRLVTRDEARRSNSVEYASLIGNPVVTSSEDLIYTVSLYDDREELVSTTIPTNTGKPMNSIPFFVITPFGIGFECAKPPVLDIADINISHYCTSADLEHGRHFTGLPTPVVKGVEAGTKLKVGSLTAWILPDKDADAKYLEFTGQGLSSLERAMSEKQSQLASLSARILDNSKNGSEAADTVRLRYMSETASLSSIARSVEALLNRCYKTAAIMESIDPDSVDAKLDKEFLDTRMSPADLLKMTESYLTGGMTVETYVFNMRRGDLLPVTRTDEEEISDLEAAKAAIEAAALKAVQKPTGGQ